MKKRPEMIDLEIYQPIAKTWAVKIGKVLELEDVVTISVDLVESLFELLDYPGIDGYDLVRALNDNYYKEGGNYELVLF